MLYIRIFSILLQPLYIYKYNIISIYRKPAQVQPAGGLTLYLYQFVYSSEVVKKRE